MGLEYIPRYCIAPLRRGPSAEAADAGARRHCPRGTDGNPRDTCGKMWQAMEDVMRTVLLGFAMVLMAAGTPRAAAGAEIKVLTAGAFKQVLLALVPDFERATGHKVTVQNDTVGALTKRIEGGEAFDLAVLTPKAVDDLAKEGKFVAGLLDKLGIAAEVKPKAKLIPGGVVAEHVAKGEAELGIHQISEILPVKGVTLVGPLPAEIQNYTVYAAGIGAQAKESAAAKALLNALSSPAAAEVLKSKGMEPAGS